MPERTPAEIQAQREAWMARKAARAAGLDVPSEAPATAAPEPVVEAAAAEPVAPPPAAPAPVVAPAAAPAPVAPLAPDQKRSPEEVRAQREAFLAAKAAKAAGAAAPPPPAPKPVEAPKPKPAAASAPRPAAEKAAPPVVAKTDPHVTRREFLNYAWLASMALFTAQTVGASLWFAFPNFKAGQFGGQFSLGSALEVLPEVNSVPKPYTDGKFWLINVDGESSSGEPKKGVMAIYKVCTHLGCLYEWVPMTNRFECPCHGSKFTLTGDYIEGPARRSLDRFVIQVVGPDGAVITQTNPAGEPLELPSGDVQIVIDTGQRILGAAVITPA